MSHEDQSSTFYHVYILQSISHPDRFYTGITEHLEQRLGEHNRGTYHHTSSHRPWRIKTIISFTDEDQARSFERYLKTSSGRAFAKKRL